MGKGSTILIVSFLVWLRWLISSLSGYIHPDEFFQNPEITSSTIFGIDTFIPWEYKTEHASRSIVAPFLTTGLPFYILKSFLKEGEFPSSYTLFMTERFGSFFWSLIIDLCVYRLCKRLDTKPTIPMLLVATSQVTLAYYTHTFSNSFESVLLCLSLMTYTDYAKEPTLKKSFYLGALFSLGIFTRITFPLYAFPIGLAYLYQAYRKSANIHYFTAAVLPFAWGLMAFFGFCVVADSAYYGTLTLTVHDVPFHGIWHFLKTVFNPLAMSYFKAQGRLIVTPFNNFIYNLNVDNLAQHGIHPRYTHVLINLPLLFGPLVIFGVLAFSSLINKIKRTKTQESTHFIYVLLGVVFSGLVGLSIMPHQEARFLCPLLVPLVLIYTWTLPSLPFWFWATWFIFNIITTYIFGVIHQGGLVPTMSFLHRQVTGLHDCRVLNRDLTCITGDSTETNTKGFNLTTNLVFYKTYMPPQHLLIVPKEDNGNHHVNVLDYSSRLDDLVTQLERSSGVTLRKHNGQKPEVDFARSMNNPNSFERTLFVTPNFVPLPKIIGHRYMLLAKYSPHIGFDDLDAMMERVSETESPESQMNLNIFLILSEEENTAQ